MLPEYAREKILLKTFKVIDVTLMAHGTFKVFTVTNDLKKKLWKSLKSTELYTSKYFQSFQYTKKTHIFWSIVRYYDFRLFVLDLYTYLINLMTFQFYEYGSIGFVEEI